MKPVAIPMMAITHIQKIAPGPPATIAIATPEIFAAPTREAADILVGEIRDEFDEDEVADIQELGSEEYLINEYLVTIAGAATWAYADNNELGKIAEIVDYIAIMAYDINGTWTGITGHNAPLYYDDLEAKVRGWSYGVSQTPNVYSAVPKDKLLLGVPFYGHSWAGCNVETDGD